MRQQAYLVKGSASRSSMRASAQDAFETDRALLSARRSHRRAVDDLLLRGRLARSSLFITSTRSRCTRISSISTASKTMCVGRGRAPVCRRHHAAPHGFRQQYLQRRGRHARDRLQDRAHAHAEHLRQDEHPKRRDENFTGDDVLEGITAVISVKLREIQFEGQTKAKLGTSRSAGRGRDRLRRSVRAHSLKRIRTTRAPSSTRCCSL